jgi:type I site-specific restriction endonuclease
MTGSGYMPVSAQSKYRQAKGRVTRAVAQKTSKNFQPHGKGHVFVVGFVTNYGDLVSLCRNGAFLTR